MDRDELDGLKKELTLWSSYPSAMAMIKASSVLYLTLQKDDDTTMIYPIIAEFSRDTSCDETMRLAEVIAAVCKEPDAEPLQIFKILTDRFPLSKALASHTSLLGNETAVQRLEAVYRLAEYLQVPKVTSLRLLQSIHAERWRQNKEATVAAIKDDPCLKPLIECALLYIADRPVPKQLMKAQSSFKADSDTPADHGAYLGKRDPLDLGDLCKNSFVLNGLFCVPHERISGLLGMDCLGFFQSHVFYLLGQAIAGHKLAGGILTALKGQISLCYSRTLDEKMSERICCDAVHAVEASALMGRFEHVHELVTVGGLKLSPYLRVIIDANQSATFQQVSLWPLKAFQAQRAPTPAASAAPAPAPAAVPAPAARENPFGGFFGAVRFGPNPAAVPAPAAGEHPFGAAFGGPRPGPNAAQPVNVFGAFGALVEPIPPAGGPFGVAR
jgi:hypothetical protein